MKAKKTVRDGETTQKKIFKSAEKLFADSGFSGVSLGKISQDSGVSEGLILHHFKNKENLYTIVRERIAERYQAELRKNTKFPKESPDTMFKVLRTAFGFNQKNRKYHRILLWSYLEGQEGFVETEALIMKKLVEITKDVQTQGALKDHFDPLFLLVIARGTLDYWIRYRSQFKKIFQIEETEQALDEKFLDQFFQIILKGVSTKNSSAP